MKLNQKQQNALRVLYVKALRLANNEPTEVQEIRHLYMKVLQTEDQTKATIFGSDGLVPASPAKD